MPLKKDQEINKNLKKKNLNEKKTVSPPNQKTETCNMTKQVKIIF